MSDCTLLRELLPQMYASDDLMKSKENRFQNRISLCLRDFTFDDRIL